MRRNVLCLSAFLAVMVMAQQDAFAQLYCEQPGCASYPGASISDGVYDPANPTIPDPSNLDSPSLGTGDIGSMDNLSDFNTAGTFASLGGTSFVSTDASMIGDLIGPRLNFSGQSLITPTGTTRFKLADNQSPLPRNRVFYNYSHFNNSVRDINGNASYDSIDRHTFGLERMILDGMASVEFRVPFANTANSTQVAGSAFGQATEFGDLGFAGKVLLMNRGIFQMSAGVAGTLPTASDFEIVDNLGNVQQVLENEAIHIGPFVGFVVRPGSRLTVQSVIQLDFDTGGNTYQNFGQGISEDFQDHSLLMFALSSAYWIRQGRSDSIISDIAAIVELHYTTSTASGDIIRNPAFSVGHSEDFQRRMAFVATQGESFAMLNLTAGTELRFGPQNSVVIGCGVPLRGEQGDRVQDRLFDAEVLVNYNRFY